MPVNDSIAFVRAKSNKISVAETYTYQVQIADYTSMSFSEASGEIKVEFLYDGEGGNRRWKELTFWKGLREKWKLANFLGKGWLGRTLEKMLLGNWEDNKYFGAPAVADTEKYNSSHTVAQAGYLSLRGYHKPNFMEDWPNDRSLFLQIPIAELTQKLARSEKFELSFKYPLNEPQSPPVRLKEIRLTDEAMLLSDEQTWMPIETQTEELHSKFDELLRLEFEMELEGGAPALKSDGTFCAKMSETTLPKKLESNIIGRGEKIDVSTTKYSAQPQR